MLRACCRALDPAFGHRCGPQVANVGSRRDGKSLSARQLPQQSPAVLAAQTEGLPFPDRHFAVFMIYSWNYELFWTSLQTYMAAGWGRRVIVLDNSLYKTVLNDSGARSS